jgi:peptide/nickel transport system substrate-binding protein
VALSLLAASCGGKKLEDVGKSTSLASRGMTAADGESGLAQAGEPKRGGKLVYGLEADSSGGYCLPEGQLAISGMMVVRAVYDTLTVPNAAGGYTPYLASSVTPNKTYDRWTITLRPNIKFHDGSPLTSTVVKNNLDAFRGQYPGRSSLLFQFVLSNIDTITTTGTLTLVVKTKVPWVAFPAFLYSSSRLGIMAQAQLDDKNKCDRRLIGTGPFVFKKWIPNEKIEMVRNPNYWQIAPDGKPYPYLDALEFRAMPDSSIRNNAIQSGEIQAMHTSNADDMVNVLYGLRQSGQINMYVSEDNAEISFLQLNHTKPPFDDPRMREALAIGADRSKINISQNAGGPTVAEGPFAPGSIAYLPDPGFPPYDLARARKLVKEYVADGGSSSFNLTCTTDPSTVRLAELIQQRAAEAGVTVKIIKREQAALINDAIGKKYQAMTFRNYPGGDPDINYVWWYSAKTNPVNFGGWDDPVVDKLLDQGRSELDPAKRKKIYQDLNRRMATQVHGIWSWFTPWAIVERPNVHNVLGPPLPPAVIDGPGLESTTDEDFEPNTGLATGHSLIGMWIG